VDVRVLVGTARASALAFAGRTAPAEAALAELLPLAESLHGGRGNRLAAVYSTLEQLQRAQGRHRAAATSAARVVSLFEATLPESVYLAYALKTLGLNLRLVGDREAAVAALTRAESMFRRVEGEGSAEARWCAINRLAAVVRPDGPAVAFEDLAAEAQRYLDGADATFARVVRLLLAETAADRGDARAALRALERLDEPAAAETGMRARVDALRRQIAWIEGAPVVAADLAFADALAASGEGGVTHARLRRVLARHAPSAEACRSARDAWAEVDPTQGAWRNGESTLARCP
jgi:tetratricopeptide (TPR) repeat protein